MIDSLYASLSSPFNTIAVFVLFAAGIFLIVKGGDWFVDSASWVAEISGLPKFIIGATVVSIATTLPEVIVSVMAAAGGSVQMAVGNALGSVTANTGLIMAVSIMFMPAVIERRKYLPKSIMLMLAIVLLFLFSLQGSLGYLGSIVMFALFLVFIAENIYEGKNELGTNTDSDVKRDKKTVIKNIAFFIIGAVFLFLGSRLLVDSGTIIAVDIFKVDPRIVSLTLVAIGTSLPEFVTTITAIIKKESSLSIGNIIGANIIDMLLILPICSFIYGGALPVEASTIWIDIPVALLVTVIALIPALIRGKLMRWQGILAVTVYIGYLVYVCAAV